MKNFARGAACLAASLLLLLSAPAIEAQTVTYRLAPGSSITAPAPSGSEPVTEPLSGALQLTVGTPQPPNTVYFLAVTDIQLTSRSFDLAGQTGLFHLSTLDPPGTQRFELQGQLNGREIAPRSTNGRADRPFGLEGGTFPGRIEAHDVTGDSVVLELTLVADLGDGEDPAAGDGAPSRVVLRANYPNPFNPATTIEFQLQGAGSSLVPVELDIFNAAGHRVRTLIHAAMSAGPHSQHWDGTDEAGQQVAAGVYVYELRASGLRASRKMILIK
jgi:FlgD Ig-like domain